MCCFSQAVERVSNTNIFARRNNGRQLLAYSMTYRARTELAMVLPLPVPADEPEDALRFINLEAYPNLFTDLRSGFPTSLSRSGAFMGGPAIAALPTLEVHDVGSFEASFVPTLEDFDRLDERFRIPPDAMGAIPHYRDYGFAVFKLKPAIRESDVHPMAFEFPCRDPNRLFFPTVHIHDGHVHPKAQFDHTLYCQSPARPELRGAWERSTMIAWGFVSLERAAGLVDGNAHCWRRTLQGTFSNADIWI